MRRVAYVLFGLGSLACGLGRLLPTRLPEARPADFRVVWAQSGGMLPESSSVTFADGALEVEHMEQGVETKRRMPVTAEQADTLYSAVRAHRFDRIELQTHGLVYDAGGENVVVTAGGQTWSAGASATQDVAPGSQADFDAVREALFALQAEAAPAPG